MSQSHQYSFSIAGVSVRLETEQCFAEDENFLPFFSEEGKPDYLVRFRRVSQLPSIPDTVLYADLNFRIHPDGRGGYLRSFLDSGKDPAPYAVTTYDFPRGILTVDYLQDGIRHFSGINNSFFHLGFEAMLIRKDRLCLHAACVDTPLGGILFSGPSGIGKSTQAGLWCQYRGAEQINGDRPILSREPDGWLAWGSPYAGSSRCHVNKSCPVTAIVMLRQAPQCSLRRLNQAETFRAVWSGLTMNSWDAEFVATACDLTMALLDAVPVFEFSCTPDEQAVNCLDQGLRKELSL